MPIANIFFPRFGENQDKFSLSILSSLLGQMRWAVVWVSLIVWISLGHHSISTQRVHASNDSP